MNQGVENPDKDPAPASRLEFETPGQSLPAKPWMAQPKSRKSPTGVQTEWKG